MKKLKPYKWHIAALVGFILLNIIGTEVMPEGALISDIVRSIGGAGVIITLFITALKISRVKKR